MSLEGEREERGRGRRIEWKSANEKERSERARTWTRKSKPPTTTMAAATTMSTRSEIAIHSSAIPCSAHFSTRQPPRCLTLSSRGSARRKKGALAPCALPNDAAFFADVALATQSAVASFPPAASLETAVYAVSCYLDTMVQQSLAGKEIKKKKKTKKKTKKRRSKIGERLALSANDDDDDDDAHKKKKNSNLFILRPDPGHLCARRRRRPRDLPVALHSLCASLDDWVHQRIQRGGARRSGEGKRERRRRSDELQGRRRRRRRRR